MLKAPAFIFVMCRLHRRVSVTNANRLWNILSGMKMSGRNPRQLFCGRLGSLLGITIWRDGGSLLPPFGTIVAGFEINLFPIQQQ